MIHTVLAWVGICIVILATIWTFTLAKLDQEKAAITKEGKKDAFFLSQSYAEQLDRSIGQIDQLLSQIRYVWVKTNGSVSLEHQHQEGLLPLMLNSMAWIVNRHGRIVSSTVSATIGDDVAKAPYFHQFEQHALNGLYIGDPVAKEDSHAMLIHFARQVISPSGEFDGVVVFAVSPDYLKSFTSELNLGRNDSVTLKKMDGTLLASRRGADIRTVPTIYRSPSTFEQDNGVEHLGADTFVDGIPRFVAWHRLKKYPLKSIVNQSENDIFAVYTIMKRDYLTFATASSVMVFGFTLVGVGFSRRLISRKKQAEEIKDTYRLATEAAKEGFFTVKAVYSTNREIEDFVIEDCNDRGASFIGFARADAIGAKFSVIYPNLSARQVFSVFIQAMETGYYEDEIKVLTRDKSKPSWIHRRIVRSGNGLAVTLRDISDAKVYQMELTKIAQTDALTGLPNRHWLISYLPSALEQAKKNNTAMAILFLDLDDFKIINDTQGHAAGDELLRAVAQRIQGILRPHDNIARIGGDEFTIISEGYETQADVSPLAERVIAVLSAPFISKDGHSHTIGISIGFSIFQEDGLDAETLLKHADIAMYAAKNEGKNQYKAYQPHLSERLISRIDNGKAIKKAIELDEFVLHFQPRVSTQTGEMESMEALLRWQHPTRGLAPPIEFIPFAEETGLIVELGTLVIQKACMQIAQWQAARLPIVPLSINVSAQQLNKGDLSQILESNLNTYGIDAANIELEITESSMLVDTGFVIEELSQIKKLGIRLSIDDFGTGYSSMFQLQRLDLDVLKIDQSFTRLLTNGRDGETFFRAMISMTHELGMKVVAEGVETQDELIKLRRLSCDYIQGYYISRPVAAAKVPDMLRRRFLFPNEQTIH